MHSQSKNKEQLLVIKIGGNVIDDDEALNSFLKTFASIEGKKILVHGGGKLATRVSEAMGIPQQMINGRRITDAETLKVVTMVYAGYINKNIVAKLQSENCNAIGITGADGGIIKAHKRINTETDYGFAGDIDSVDMSTMKLFLENGLTPVIAPITSDDTSLLNTNADTIAHEIASAGSELYDTSLIYCFEKKGVLQDPADNDSVIPRISETEYTVLKSDGIISAGMIPKLDNSFAAIKSGVKAVIIGDASDLTALINRTSGTLIHG